MINIFQPTLGHEEITELKKVFDSNWIGKGPQEKVFRENFASKLKLNNSEQLLTTTSCTEGIFLSSNLFDFNESDEIIIPTITFPSVVSAFIDANVKIVFCDVERHTLNPTIDTIKPWVTKRTKAIFLTHYGGVPIDMDPILAYCEENNILVFEDAACSVDSFYKGKACGTLGDYGVWSFDAMKTLTTGDGGMIYIKDKAKRAKAEQLLYLGLPSKEKSGLDSSKESSINWWEYSIELPGRRAIMNDISAAIGNCQLIKLPHFIKKREEIFNFYQKELEDLESINLPRLPKYDFKSSYYFYWIQSDNRDALAQHLISNDIYCTFRYYPVNKIEYFCENSINGHEEFPNTNWINKSTLNIPLHQSLSNSDISHIINTIRDFITSWK